MKEYFKKLFAYNDWANREVLAALEKAKNAPTKSMAVMAHLVAAEWLWWARLKRQEKRFAVWPELTLDRFGSQLDELAEQWKLYLENPSLGQSVEYVNSKGERWTSGVEDILTHVAMHSHYHRGQIAAQLRESGDVPPYTDFIHPVRQGLMR
ncbi:MAG TPA: DinB family protein [Vicinamibacteria bacterium]|jgi:uncharacterized damage-inducible protein DinB